MPAETISIKRYPNRRLYARNSSKYVSLPEIEEMIRQGATVEIRDNQTGEDITRTVLTQLIIDRQPEKISLFPADMLHFIVRSNDMMSDFLRDYFRQSLTYLNYLQQHGASSPGLRNPMHWAKAWLDGLAAAPDTAPEEPGREAELAQRVAELEERIRQLEEK